MKTRGPPSRLLLTGFVRPTTKLNRTAPLTTLPARVFPCVLGEEVKTVKTDAELERIASIQDKRRYWEAVKVLRKQEGLRLAAIHERRALENQVRS